jgi:hypothetical protein
MAVQEMAHGSRMIYQMAEQSTDQIYAEYLPELDCVSTGKGMVIIVVVAWLMVSAIAGALCGVVYAVIRFGRSTPFNLVEFIAVSAAFGVVAALLMLRTNWFDCQWSTDSSGLTIRGLSRERRVEWSAITQATGKAAESDKIVCTLKTSSGKIVVSDLLGSTGGLIGASIYQHLRKYGKGDESLLSPSARTFWTPIPGEIPSEMDWHNPHPPDWPLTLVVALLVLIAVPLVYYLGPNVRWGDAWKYLHQFAAGVIPLGYFKFRERLIAARTVSVRHDGIEMRTARRMVYVPWRDIGCVQWHQQQNTLTIGRSSYSDVGMIRYRADDLSSAILILAIIRQLRLVHHKPPVAIPRPLLPMLGATAALAIGQAISGPVEVRPTSAFPLVVTVLVLIVEAMVVFMLWGTGIFPVIGLVALAAANLLAIGAVLRAHSRIYRADSEGITLTSLGRSTHVSWQEVAQYVVKPVAGSSTVRRILKASSGYTLLTLPLSQASRPDIDLFNAYVDARLSAVRQDGTRVLMR